MDSKELERTLSILNDAAQSGRDFVWEQAPMVAKEVVYWHIGAGAVAFLFALFLTVICVMYVRNAGRVIENPAFDWDDPSETHLISIIVGVVSFMVFIPALCSLYDASKKIVQGTIAPRLVIIEYVANVMKK